MEEEFVTNQERLKPQEARAEEERTKVDDLRGTPMSVGSLEELIDDKCVPCCKQRPPFCPGLALPASPARHRLTPPLCRSHAIVSSSVGPEYYVNILSFVDKSQARKQWGQCARRVSLLEPPACLTHGAPGQLEPGCSVLLHSKSMSVVGILSDEADPLVSVMKARARGQCTASPPRPGTHLLCPAGGESAAGVVRGHWRAGGADPGDQGGSGAAADAPRAVRAPPTPETPAVITTDFPRVSGTRTLASSRRKVSSCTGSPARARRSWRRPSPTARPPPSCASSAAS